MASLNATGFAQALLQALGAPVTSAMVDFIVRWEAAEGGTWNNNLPFNPLNVAAFDANPVNGQSAGNTSWQEGIQATARVIEQDNMSGILNGIMSGDPNQALNGLVNSPWASSHYGGGANFPSSAGNYGSMSIDDGQGSMNLPAISQGGGGSGSINIPSLSPGGGTSNVSPVLDSATLASSYGYSAAMLNSNPELKALFSQAVAGGWSADRFTAALQNTTWFQQNSDTQRKFSAQGSVDPATQAQNVMQQQVSIQTAGAKAGAKIDDATAHSLAVTSLQSGWNADQLNQAIAGYIQWDQYGHLGGSAGDEEMNLRQLANNNGATISDQWILDATRQIGQGKASLESFQGQIRTIAARQYPAYADQIQKGINLSDLASPYASELQKILETGPESSVLTTPLMQKALQYVDPKTGQPAPMPIWQFQDTLKQDPKWMGTQNAQDSLMGAGHQVLRDFGFQW